ncbi:hypothetical protein RFI_25026 [Reticulomyxa filosa]|uniref:Uncharacterized protein n=1 Tax=Reticulomyxa filosa TaxID=46433 RepID=X6MEN3_RETFI|nr:hypothetical protein RFI_25026 [Reticulomyxa filosa]|eukprot:ETO12349.1 hypothetical protein RFI_25026 [Reticulomyxa filosa]
MNWELLVENEESGDIPLPPQQRIQIDDKGGFVERSYFKSKDTNTYVMRERHGRVTTTSKKVVKSVGKRRQNWVKFGRVAKQPKGYIDEGITGVRSDPVFIEWADDKGATKPKTSKRAPPTTTKAKPAPAKFVPSIRREAQKERSILPHSQNEVFEMRLGNLPQEIDEMHVRQLVEEFYMKAKSQRPPRYIRIKTMHFLKDDHCVIVQFPSQNDRDQAIEYFDGKKFLYQLLSAEKSKPRPRYVNYGQ